MVLTAAPLQGCTARLLSAQRPVSYQRPPRPSLVSPPIRTPFCGQSLGQFHARFGIRKGHYKPSYRLGTRVTCSQREGAQKGHFGEASIPERSQESTIFQRIDWGEAARSTLGKAQLLARRIAGPLLLLVVLVTAQFMVVGRANAARRGAPPPPAPAASVVVKEASARDVVKPTQATRGEAPQGPKEAVLSEAGWNEQAQRWEMSLQGFSKALDGELLDRTVWRWDDSAIRCRLKGAEQEYYVDLSSLERGDAVDLKARLESIGWQIGFGPDWPRNSLEEVELRLKKNIVHEYGLQSAQEVAGGLERSNNFGFGMPLPADPRGSYRKDPFIFFRSAVGFLVGLVMLVYFDSRPWGNFGEAFSGRRAFDIFKKLKKQTQKYRPTTMFSDIGGLDSVMEELRETVAFLKDPARYDYLGARPPRGLLLVGAPGTGKTMLAEAIAGEAAVNILFVDARQFMAEDNEDTLVGVQAGRIRDLFKSAREQGPCILFIDEIDAIAKRSYGQQDGPQQGDRKQAENESCINQMLVELDGFNTGKEAGVIVMGATNRPDILDPALTRPGRMDRVIEMPLPDKWGRKKILDIYAKATVLDKDVDMDEVAARTSGMTGADLSMIFEEADWRKVLRLSDAEFAKLLPGSLAWHPGILLWKLFPYWLKARMVRSRLPWLEPGKREWGYKLTKADVSFSVDFIKMELFSERQVSSWGPWPDKIWTREFLTPHAIWVGSSSMVAALMNMPVESLGLVRDRYTRTAVASLVMKKWEESGDTEYSSRAWAEKNLVVLCAPYMAQQLLQKKEEWTDIPAEGLESARKLARIMLLREGWGPDDSVMVWWGGTRDEWLKMDSKSAPMVMSMETRKRLQRQQEQMIEAACKAAWRMLKGHEGLLRGWVERILVKQTDLSGKELRAWLEQQGAKLEDDLELFPPGKHAVYKSPALVGSSRSLTDGAGVALLAS